jgi:heptosyltransferase-2
LLAGIPKRVGYLGEVRVGLLTHRLKNPSRAHRPPMVAFYSALSGEAEVLQDRPQLTIPPERLKAALGELGLAGSDYTVFAPGAEFGPAKCWPAGHYAELALRLKRRVVLLGSGKEAGLCAQIALAANQPLPDHCLNLAGKTSLDQALCVIAGATSMVSNDSGLMHVAASLGVAQVALFGSSSPLHTPPLNARAQVLWLKNDEQYQPPLDCAPCFERICPLPAGAHMRCLNDITPARVLALLQ